MTEPPSTQSGLMPKDTFSPFSNGFEFEMWRGNNCARGRRGCRHYNPNASGSRHGCPIECALALAACTDGEIKASIGLRGGLLEPGAGGLLVEAEGDASTWRCPEYKGYDEPDDRPRRGPRPPKEQLDLLDPAERSAGGSRMPLGQSGVDASRDPLREGGAVNWALAKEEALRRLIGEGFGYAAGLDLLSPLPDDEVEREVESLLRAHRGAAEDD